MRQKQQGFTLIELMVAMLIGLFLPLAGPPLFMTIARTFALLQAVADPPEDGQQATRYMVAVLRQAGRGSTVAGAMPPIDPQNSSNDANDTLAVRYWGTSTCAGD